jgi:ATP-dependent DNA helicase PIF1
VNPGKAIFKVVDFLTRYQYRKAEELCSADDKVDIIINAVKKKGLLRIVYLKPDDEKSRRVILPLTIGQMEYQGKSYLEVRAFCMQRNAERTFRVDRILELEEAE